MVSYKVSFRVGSLNNFTFSARFPLQMLLVFWNAVVTWIFVAYPVPFHFYFLSGLKDLFLSYS